MSDYLPYIIAGLGLGIAGTIEIYRQDRAVKEFEAGLPKLEEKINAELAQVTVWEQPERFKQLSSALKSIKTYDGDSEKLYTIIIQTRDFF